jgi:hypothetical protein
VGGASSGDAKTNEEIEELRTAVPSGLLIVLQA